MRALAILLLIAGLIFTFTLGVAGFAVGPATIVFGAWLFRYETRRRQQLAATPPVEPPPPAVPRRPGWQRFLIGAACFVVIFCGMFALIWRLTAPLADAAHAFFASLESGDLASARARLATEFNAKVSDAELRRLSESGVIADYASASWDARSIQNSRGFLNGALTSKSGGILPVTIELVHENGAWKILAVHMSDTGIVGPN